MDWKLSKLEMKKTIDLGNMTKVSLMMVFSMDALKRLNILFIQFLFMFFIEVPKDGFIFLIVKANLTLSK